MKKKIFLMLVVMAMLACVFAISVSAEALVPSDSNEYGELSVIDGIPVPTVIDKNAKTVIVVNGKYYTIPTYYLLADNSYFTWSVHANVKAKLGLGSDVRGNLVRVEIPEGIMTSYNGGNGGLKMEGSTNLLEASIPTTMEIMGDHFFGKCTALTTVKGLENSKVDGIYTQAFYNTKITSISLPSTVKIIGLNAFRSTPLTSIVIPDAVESIGDHAFASCTSLATITISENSQLKSFVGEYQFEQTAISSFYFPSSLESLGNGGAFYKCASLETLINFENIQITDIPHRTFASGPKFSTISFPDGIKTIGDNAFNGHRITGDIILPNTVTTLGDHAFAGSNVACGKLVLGTGLTTITGTYTFEKTDFSEIYIHTNIAAFPYGAFKETRSDAVYYYTGTPDQLETLRSNTVNNDNGNFINANVICNYNACDAFYASEHLEDNNPCVINCTRCGANGVAEKNPVHSLSTTITYVSFIANGEKRTGCSNEGCKYGVSEDVDALLTCLGYSASNITEGAIVLGFKVNNEAVAEYESVMGNEVAYGLFVVAKNKLGENDIFDAEGKEAEGVLYADTSIRPNAVFEMKITGFVTDEQKTAEFALGAYVAVTKDGATEYSYEQTGTALEGEKYYFTSFAGIESSLKSN